MAKRFTDAAKWRNEWFRTLTLKAKLAWIYICDECDYCGIWKADYGLASFQLDFNIDHTDLFSWFGSKIYFFDTDRVLIVPFFEFQYGDSKDSWTAKIKARERLQNLGFTISNNKLQQPQTHDSGGTVGVPTPHVLIEGVGKGVVKDNKKKDEKFNEAYSLYLVRAKGPNAEDRFREQIKTEDDFVDLLKAIKHYAEHLAKPENSWRKPKQTFAAFLGTKTTGYFWRDWVSSESGTSSVENPKNWDVMTVPLSGV